MQYDTEHSGLIVCNLHTGPYNSTSPFSEIRTNVTLYNFVAINDRQNVMHSLISRFCLSCRFEYMRPALFKHGNVF